MKLGDTVASVATPIARTLNMPCIDPETQELRPESNCNKRIGWLNNFGDQFYDYFFQPETRKQGDKMKFTLQMIVVVDAEKAEDVLAKAKPPSGELVSFSVNPRPQPQQPTPTRLQGPLPLRPGS